MVQPNRILVEFKAIIDTDIGAARLVKQKYYNPNIFHQVMGNPNISDATLCMLITTREYENPFFLMLTEDIKNEADSVRKQWMEDPEMYAQTINLAEKNKLFTMVKESGNLKLDGLKYTVACQSEMEAIFIKNSGLSCDTILIPDLSTSPDVANFDTIIIKNITTLATNEHLIHKNVYIMKYKFNMDKEYSVLPDRTYVSYYRHKACEVTIIDPYKEYDAPFRHIDEAYNEMMDAQDEDKKEESNNGESNNL